MFEEVEGVERNTKNEKSMKFYAELKQVRQKKAQSLDNVYEILFVTDNCDILDLGKLPPDTLFKVVVTNK